MKKQVAPHTARTPDVKADRISIRLTVMYYASVVWLAFWVVMLSLMYPPNPILVYTVLLIGAATYSYVYTCRQKLKSLVSRLFVFIIISGIAYGIAYFFFFIISLLFYMLN